jgi:hypothetical protein
MRPRSGRLAPTAAKCALSPSDVTWSGGGGSSGRPSSRSPRSLAHSDSHWELVHKPTGAYVVGRVIRGSYSRAEMTRLRAELWELIWERLEQDVAALTRMPRRGAARARPGPHGRPYVLTSGRFTSAQLARRGIRP